MKRIITALSLISLLSLSCSKEKTPEINPYFAEVYPQVLDSIDIDCIEQESKYYISATINREDFCKYESEDEPFWFNSNISFITASPSLNLNETGSHVQKNAGVLFGDATQDRKEYFSFTFPTMTPQKDLFTHLDSLFDIENHYIMSVSDVIIEDNWTFEEKALIRKTGGFKNHFALSLSIHDNYRGDGGIAFRLTSFFGEQDGSFWRFNEVKKTIEDDGIYYFIDVDFECKLYHWPEHGKEGLWGHLENGRIRAKFKAEDVE